MTTRPGPNRMWSRRSRDAYAAPAVGLFGEFGVGNIGNEASAEAVIRLMAAEPRLITVRTIARNPAAAAETLGVPSVPMRCDASRVLSRLRSSTTFKIMAKASDAARMCFLVKRFDAILVPGMGGLEAGSVPVWGMPFTIFSLALACRLRAVPLGLISVGGTAYESAIGRTIFRKIGQWSTYVSFRDVTTRIAFAASGYDVSGDRTTPDIVFSLGPPKVETAPPDTVAIGVIEYYGDHGYTDAGYAARASYHSRLAAFAEGLLRRGFSVRFIVGDLADRSAAAELYGDLILRCPDCSDHVHFAEAGDIHELWRQILTVKFVVASRFHNLVGSAMIGRPMIALSHAVKDDDLMEQLGLRSFVRDIETFDPVELLVCFERLVDESDRISVELLKYSNAAARDTGRQIPELLDRVLPIGRGGTS